MPVPPEVITTSTFSPIAANNARLTSAPSGTTVAPGTEIPRALSQSTMIGPQRSSYTPAAAPVDAITTRPERVITIVCSSRKRSSPSPQPGLATLFAQHPDVVDAGGGVDGLDHVVERQRGDADGRQCLHLDAGAVGAAHARRDADRAVADLELDIHSVQRQLVAQRDEITGAFGGQDAGDACGGQGVALGQPARCDEVDDLGCGVQRPGSNGRALGGVLAGHVDHVRRARLVEVRKLGRAVGHRYLLTTVTGWTLGRSSAGCGNVSSPKGDSAPVRSVASSLTA